MELPQNWPGDGKGAREQKGPTPLPVFPTSFSTVTSTNVGFNPKNFLTFSFKPFAALV